jgi:hypothetical protein
MPVFDTIFAVMGKKAAITKSRVLTACTLLEE